MKTSFKKDVFIGNFWGGLIGCLFWAKEAWADSEGWSSAGLEIFGLPSNSIFNIVTYIADWLLGIIGVVAVISFVVAGILYFTSTGDDAKIKKAKGAMNASIVGVIVALSGLVVIYAVDNLFRANTF